MSETMELVSDFLEAIIIEKEADEEQISMCGGSYPWREKLRQLEIEEIRKLKDKFDKEVFGKE